MVSKPGHCNCAQVESAADNMLPEIQPMKVTLGPQQGDVVVGAEGGDDRLVAWAVPVEEARADTGETLLPGDHLRADAGHLGDEGNDRVLGWPDEFAEAVDDLEAASIEPHRTDLDDIVKVNSNDMISNYLEQAMDAEDSNDYKKALDFFNQILLLSPDNSEAIESKARLLIEELDRPLEALDCFDKMIAMNPEDERAWREKGKILYNVKE